MILSTNGLKRHIEIDLDINDSANTPEPLQTVDGFNIAFINNIESPKYLIYFQYLEKPFQ